MCLFHAFSLTNDVSVTLTLSDNFQNIALAMKDGKSDSVQKCI